MAKSTKINRTRRQEQKVKSKNSSTEKTLSNEELLALLTKLKDKDQHAHFPTDQKGTVGAIYKTLNDLADWQNKLTKQIAVSGKNAKEVEEAQRSLEEKARQLALTSKYKSEFLANMSHELRTPLNSLQILARELIDNPEGNLTEKQIQYAKTINTCGEELIELINDILDLSKIESGYLHIESEPITFREIAEYIENAFKLTSESKKLVFNVEVSEDLPDFIITDYQRLNQILKNLLSNAFKFTERGQVKLRIYKADHNWRTRSPYLDKAETVIGFEVTDTGIGISEDKQLIVFEAFQQAEGSTSRKYGGTGLGLPISRGLADLLGGVIELESVTGIGSKFTLYLPIEIPKAIKDKQAKARSKIKPKIKERVIAPIEKEEKVQEFSNLVNDDSARIGANDKVLLLIDNDANFAKHFLEKAHKHKIKVVATTKGSDVIEYLNQYHPMAIIKNISPSDTKGWKVFDRLKNDLLTRHIPIYVTSAQNDKNIALKCGARNFLLKPITEAKYKQLFTDIIEFSKKTTRQILVIDHSDEWINEIVNAIEYKDVEVFAAKSASEAIPLIEKNDFDCILMDLLSRPEERAEIITALEDINVDREFSIITYSSEDINSVERARLSKFNVHYIKRDVSALDQLVDLVSILLHRNFRDLPTEMKKRIENFSRREDILSGKKILIVDDDVRNLFAMSVGLERYGLTILTCENGQEAITTLNTTAGIDIVLMDIMMPEMDGYETMRRIRAQKQHKDLTIIAVTAKAMQGDRQKCIESGASDYITKPVNVDQLVSLMRVWLKQKNPKQYQQAV
jgi:signal transduction histidine kinase/CheY-like chemotaxis protein